MTLSEFFESMPRGYRLELAAKIKCNPTYLSHLANGVRVPSPRLSVLIENETQGKVSRYELRGDAVQIWGPQP